jgi:hypothetical protein
MCNKGLSKHVLNALLEPQALEGAQGGGFCKLWVMLVLLQLCYLGATWGLQVATCGDDGMALLL